MSTKPEDVNVEELADYEDEEPAIEVGTKTADKKVDGDTYTGVHLSGFRELSLKPELLRAIADCGFEHPSEIQQECIPQAILGTDCLAQAKSGMGKTAVFALASLQQLDPNSAGQKPACLVLCHTRELAFQITRVFERLKKYLPEITVEAFFGGVPVQTNRERLRKGAPHVVIGTPGRILQLATEKTLNLSGVKHFIIDECDQVLETMTMRHDVQKIFMLTPREKQTMMFSATLSDEIRPICKRFMHNPLEIYISAGNEKLTLHGLQQYYVQLAENEKNRKLVDLLDALEFNQCVIFVKSVARASELNRLLNSCNFPSITIHSSMTQEDRIEKYTQFKDFKSRIMVSTNLLGRGIDVERVNVVFNYDMPEGPDTYLHRVGRAGRFGTKGLAVSFVSSEEDGEVLNQVQKRFLVKITELPDEIDTSSYMQS